MSNPIQVSVNVTQPNTTLYILADSFAAFTQKVTIQPQSGQTLVATGAGEGTRIGYWTIPIATAGVNVFTILVQYDDGSGFKNSSMVQQTSFSAVTLNQVVVFSEDAQDNDDNDCLITFMWFTPSSAGRKS